jgi:hypothetical protein
MATSQFLLFAIFLLATRCNPGNVHAMTAKSTQSSLSLVKPTRLPLTTVANSVYKEETTRNLLTRRSLLLVVSTFSALIPEQSEALDGDFLSSEPSLDINTVKQPFAPRGALLPAARLKLVVDEMYALSKTLNSVGSSKEQGNIDHQYTALKEMREIWMNRPQLLQTLERRRLSTLRASSKTVPVNNNQQYSVIRGHVSNSMPYQISSMFTQAGTKRQWGILKSREIKLEQRNEIRAALNYYTSQLEYSTSSYTLTASPEIRKQLIRNDQIPTTATVITSDLDLRDLYRNEFLTCIEDAVAEISYQLDRNNKTEKLFDVSDVVDLMDQAHTALSKWFDLVSQDEVRDAMETIAIETTKKDIS